MNKNEVFSFVLIYLPLILLVVANSIMIFLSSLFLYCFNLLQKRKSKWAAILFTKSNHNLIEFYTRYGHAVIFLTMTSGLALLILFMYAFWLFFWIKFHDSLQGEILRGALIHIAFWFFAILYWVFFLKYIVRLEKIIRETKSQMLTFDKKLSEHKIFTLLPCDTPIAKMQVSFYKHTWKRLKKRIANTEKITGKTLLRFLIANNLVIDLMVPYLLLNKEQLNLDINTPDGNPFLGTPNVRFKDAQEQRLAPCEVLNIMHDYFSAMIFAPHLSNKNK